MSGRQFRKLCGSNTLPPPEDNSDNDYEPLYAKNSPSKYKYTGFVLSSHSESEHDASEPAADELPDPETSTRKKKKKKRKRKSRLLHPIVRSPSKENVELDEIDLCLMEVNAMLGAPPPAAPPVAKPPPDPKVVLFTCLSKHLNSEYELTKMFGPEEPEDGVRRRSRQHNTRLLRRAVIVPITASPANYQKSGLSMTLLSQDKDCIYFAFDHSKEYQKIHKKFLQITASRHSNMSSLEDSQKNMHVEGMLETADALFRVDAHNMANTLIEQVIAYMQHVAHPLFHLTDVKVRLEYKYTENRPFHVAVMKYMYLLTNRACHRTALELGKLLLNLDPSDPLAVLYIIDTLALRAREHQWLIDAVDYWTNERQANFLFNMRYSYALAHFHVATKDTGDFHKADNLLREAIYRFPTVAMKLLETSGKPPQAVVDCDLFKNATTTTGKNLRDLISLYTKLSWAKWREPPVLEWLNRAAMDIVDEYPFDPDLAEIARRFTKQRKRLFRGWPEEVVRHLSIIKAMSSLLIEGDIPRLSRGRAADPFPPMNSISRFGYETITTAIANAISSSPFYELFASILPHYDMTVPRQVERQLIEVRREAEAIALREARRNPNAEEDLVAELEYDAFLDEEDTSEDDMVDDDDDDDDDDDGYEMNNRPQFVQYVGAVTDAVRRIIDVYQQENPLSANERARARPGRSSDPDTEDLSSDTDEESEDQEDEDQNAVQEDEDQNAVQEDEEKNAVLEDEQLHAVQEDEQLNKDQEDEQQYEDQEDEQQYEDQEDKQQKDFQEDDQQNAEKAHQNADNRSGDQVGGEKHNLDISSEKNGSETGNKTSRHENGDKRLSSNDKTETQRQGQQSTDRHTAN